jgi:hypothetical protein
MGVLTDLIVAKPEEAAAISADDSSKWPREDVKGIDQVALGSLWTLLSGHDHDDVDEFTCVFEASEEGPWVYLVPDELVGRLAAIRTDELGALVESWAATFYSAPEDLVETLEVISRLAQRAQKDGSALLIWLSL